jgi:hypothetical protein
MRRAGRRKAHLDPLGAPQPRHLAELGVGQQHHAAALRDAPNRDAKRPRLVEDSLEDARALATRDLEAVPQTVGEARSGFGHTPALNVAMGLQRATQLGQRAAGGPGAAHAVAAPVATRTWCSRVAS